MLGCSNPQLDFFTEYAYGHLLPANHELIEIRKRVDFGFVTEEVGDLYCPNNGRPSWDPEVLFRAIFLEFYTNLSDRELEDQLRVNLLYRWFCGLPLDAGTPDATTLVVFRTRLGEERFQRVFDRLVEECRTRGLLKGQVKRVDATHVLMNAAVRNMTVMLRDGQRALKQRIGKTNPELARSLDQDFPNQPTLHRLGTEEELSQEVTRTEEILTRTSRLEEAPVEEARRFLRNVISGGPDSMVSLTDPDARWGYKHKTMKFAGYKVHISEDESELVTTVQTLAGNEHEGAHLNDILDEDRRKEIPATVVTADSLYESAENYRATQAMGLKAHFNRKFKGKKISRFEYDPVRDVLRCAAGKESSFKTSHVEKKAELYYFSQWDCQRCSLKSDCIQGKLKRQRVFLSEVQRHAWAISDSDRRSLKIQRMQVERKFAEAKQWGGLRRARYRRRPRMAIQALMTFFVINTKRMLKLVPPRSSVLQIAQN